MSQRGWSKRWSPDSPHPVTLVTEPGGPEITVDAEELEEIARLLADRAAELIREHLHVEPDDVTWCPLCHTDTSRH